MKICAYCGRKNEDQATRCLECRTEFVPVQERAAQSSEEPNPGGRLEHIAVLDNEVQAGLVDAMLSEREIPHLMQSYHDSALDGIFQTQKGWGVILAPPDFRNEILAALEDIKRQSESFLDGQEPNPS